MVYIGNSKCRHCGTPVEGKILPESPITRMDKHKFKKNGFRADGSVNTTYECYNCGKEDDFILREVL